MRHHSIRKGSNHFGKKVTNKPHIWSSGEALGGSGEAPGRPWGGSGRLRGGSREALGRSGRPDEGPEVSKEAQGGSGEAPGKRLGGDLGEPGGHVPGVLGTSWRHLRPSQGFLALLMEARGGIASGASFCDQI